MCLWYKEKHGHSIYSSSYQEMNSLFLPSCDLFWITEPSRSNIVCVLEPSLSRPCSFYMCHRGVLVLIPASEAAGVANSRKRDHVEKNWQLRHTDRTWFLLPDVWGHLVPLSPANLLQLNVATWMCQGKISRANVWLTYRPMRNINCCRFKPLSFRVTCYATIVNWYRGYGISRPDCTERDSPGDLPNPGIEPGSPALRADALPSEPPGKPRERLRHLSCSHWPSWVTRWVRPCGMKTVPCDLPTEYSYFMRPGKTRRKNSPLVHKIVRNGKMLF